MKKYLMLLALANASLYAQEEIDYYNINHRNVSAKDIARSISNFYSQPEQVRTRRITKLIENQKPLHKYYVVSESMLPTITVGSNIYADESAKFDDLKVGDIIVYRTSVKNDAFAKNIVHRVFKRQGQFVVCKGDNNSVEDREVVTESNFLGKVVKIDSMTIASYE
jgi:signal peptidase I